MFRSGDIQILVCRKIQNISALKNLLSCRFSFDNLMTYVDYELNNYRIFFILRNLNTKVFMDVVSCVYDFSNGSEGKNKVYIYIHTIYNIPIYICTYIYITMFVCTQKP